jgi:AbrB family looped-hinge helix DNA binding protein
MLSARISAKNQITLPKKVRQALDVKAGERLLFVVEDNAVSLRAMGPTTAEDLAGSLRRYATGRRTPAKVREMVKREVARAAAQEG